MHILNCYLLSFSQINQNYSYFLFLRIKCNELCYYETLRLLNFMSMYLINAQDLLCITEEYDSIL